MNQLAFNPKEALERINKYFANVTEAQLKEDLGKAGYEFYKHVDFPVLATAENRKG